MTRTIGAAGAEQVANRRSSSSPRRELNWIWSRSRRTSPEEEAVKLGTRPFGQCWIRSALTASKHCDLALGVAVKPHAFGVPLRDKRISNIANMNCENLMKDLDFKPRYTMETGLTEYVNAVRKSAGLAPVKA
jgi:hypothetical protein